MAALSVVRINFKDGTVKFAGKEGWKSTDKPEFVMEHKSAIGKARYWKQNCMKPGYRELYQKVKSIDIIPCTIEIYDGICDSIIIEE